MDSGKTMALGSALAALREAQTIMTTTPGLEVPERTVSALTGVIADLMLAGHEELTCYRCNRTRPTADLEPTTEGAFKCSPDGPSYDDCMRIFNTV